MKIPVIKFNVQDLETLRQQLITLQDNINRALAEIPFSYGEVLEFQFYPENLPRRISHSMPRPATGLTPVFFRNLTLDTTVPMYGLFVDWIPEQGGIKIRSISGLTTGNLYQVRFLTYA